MTDILLRTQGLGKRYGEKHALKDVDIHVRRGDIYGLIGRNGAGKTTLMKIVNRQIHQNAGDAFLNDVPLSQAASHDLRIGTLVEVPNLYPDCDARENLTYKRIAMGLPKEDDHAALIELVGLADARRKKVKQYSLGMKQRLGIAMALLGDPELLMLDEPINGMDPQGIADIRQMLVRLNRERGTTIIISSHILDELAKFASVYGIINEGQLIREVARRELETENRTDIQIVTDQAETASALIAEKAGVSAHIGEDGRTLQVKDSADKHQMISRLLFDEGIYVESFHVRHQTLEEYFMQLTGGGHGA